MTEWKVPEDWKGQQVVVAFPIPMQNKQTGELEFASASGQFQSDLGGAILLRTSKGELIITKGNIHSVTRPSSIAVDIQSLKGR